MKSLAEDPLTEARAKVINDPDLRQLYYEEHQRVARERTKHHERDAEYKSTKEERKAALWQRLNYDPAEAQRRLKAKIKDIVDFESAERRAEWEREKMFVWAMVGAAQRRLRELGIK